TLSGVSSTETMCALGYWDKVVFWSPTPYRHEHRLRLGVNGSSICFLERVVPLRLPTSHCPKKMGLRERFWTTLTSRRIVRDVITSLRSAMDWKTSINSVNGV